MNRARSFRKTARILGALFVFAGFVLCAVLFWLSSEAGARVVLGFVQEKLHRDAHLDLQYQSGAFHPLSGFEFSDLRLQPSALDQKSLSVSMGRLKAAYGVRLFPARVMIHELTVEDVRVQGRVRIGVSESKPESVPVKNAGALAALQSLEGFLDDPPAEVEIALVQIKNVDLELDVESFSQTADSAQTSSKLSARGLNWSMSANVKRDQAHVKSGWYMDAPLNWRIQSSELSVGSSIESKSELELTIRRENRDWIYDFKAPKSSFDLLNFAGEQRQATGPPRQIRLKSLNLGLGSSVRIRHLARVAPMESIFQIEDITQHLDMGLERLVAPQLVELEHVRIAGEMGLGAAHPTQRLQDAITGTIKTAIVGLKIPNQIPVPIGVEIPIQFELARDFSQASLQSELAVLFRIKGVQKKLSVLVADFVATHRLSAPAQAQASLPANSAKVDLKLRLDKSLGGVFPAMRSSEKFGTIDLATKVSIDQADDGGITIRDVTDLPLIRLPGLKSVSRIQHTGVTTILVRTNADQNQRAQLGGEAATSNRRTVAVESAIEFDNLDFGKWVLKNLVHLEMGRQLQSVVGHATVEQMRRAKSNVVPVDAKSAMDLKYEVALPQGRQSVSLLLDLPMLSIDKKALLDSTKVNVQMRAADFANPMNLVVSGKIQQSGLTLDPSLASSPVRLDGLNSEFTVSMSTADEFTVDRFQVSFAKPFFRFTGEGRGALKSKDLQLDSQLDMEIPQNLPQLAGHSLKGSLSVPLELAVVQGRDLSMRGQVRLKDVSWKKETIGLSGAQGSISFDEKIVFRDSQFRFQTILQQNPFERVDFDRLRPLLGRRNSFKIDSILVDGREYGPFVGAMSIQQNLLFAHQFDLDLHAGEVYGEMSLDLLPGNLQLALLARMTKVDLNEVLPKKFLSRMSLGKKPISARAGMTMNLNRGTLDGRVDVTEIGSEQVVSMINILDPGYEDAKMNKARKALQFGYPTDTTLVFADGFLDLDLGLNVLGVSQRQRLNGISISGLINAKSSDVVQKLNESELKSDAPMDPSEQEISE